MYRALIFFSVAISLFLIACVREPKDRDAASIIDKTIADQKFCGDGTLQSWEACEYGDAAICDPQLYISGIMHCNIACMEWDTDECYLRSSCRIDRCNNTGECEIENNNYFCLCDEGYTGSSCTDCADEYYRKDLFCVKDMRCEEAACTEHQRCEISLSGIVRCFCQKPWTGIDCTDCASGYHKNGEDCAPNVACVSDSCTHYEKCDDTSGLPVCSCNNENHDPNDCSKCLSDYTVEDYLCINTKTASCTPNPDKPAHAHDLPGEHEVTYTDEAGWNAAPHCSWACDEEYVAISPELCSKFEKWQIEWEGKIFNDVAIGRDGRIYIMTASHLFAFDENATALWEYAFASSHSNGSYGEVVIRPDNSIFAGDAILDIEGNLLTPEPLYGTMSISHAACGNDGTIYHDHSGAFDYWGRPIPYWGLYLYGFTTITPGNHLVVYYNGEITGADPDGSTQWTSDEAGDYEEEMAVDYDGTVFYSYQYDVNAVSPTGERRTVWSSPTTIATSPVIDESGNIFGLTKKGGLFKLKRDGTLVWKLTPANSSTACSYITPVLGQDAIIFITYCPENSAPTTLYSTAYYAYSYSGALLWSYSLTAQTQVPKQLQLSLDGTAYVTFSTKLLAVRPAAILPRKNAAWPMLRHDAQHSRNFNAPLFNQPPSIPLYLSPVDSAGVVILPANFLWTSSDDEDGDSITYDIRFGSDKSNLTTIATGVISTSMPIPEGTAPGTYYWQVLAKDSRNSVAFSDIWSFTITAP